jgi:cytochrome b561/polyisoprenoid-binding protein YceI
MVEMVEAAGGIEPTGSRPRYSTVAIILHWTIALLVIALIVLGWRMEATRGMDQFVIFQLHKSIGILVLLLTLVRIGWRLTHRPPAIGLDAWWERGLARLVHVLFYVALIALPISGWIAVSTSEIRVPTVLFGLVPWPDFPGSAGLAADARHAWHEVSESIHVALTWLMYGLVLLHVAGALKHHLFDGGDSFARMAPGAVPRRFADPRLLGVLAAVVLVSSGAAAYRSFSAPAAAPAAPAPSAEIAAPSDEQAAQPPEPEAADPLDNAAAAAEEPQEAAEVEPSTWTVRPGSAIRFATSWSGQEIAGSFATWTATIRFSPEALDTSSVRVVIDIASLSTGRGDVDSSLPGETWFDTAKFPQATFTSDRFEKVGADRYRASGTLTMRGVSRPLSFPFTLKISGDEATMDAAISLDRTRFGVGQGEYAATDSIPADVAVKVALKARRQP